MPNPRLTEKSPVPVSRARHVLGFTENVKDPPGWWMVKAPPGNDSKPLLFPEYSVPPALNTPLAMMDPGWLLAETMRKCSMPLLGEAEASAGEARAAAEAITAMPPAMRTFET